MIDDKGIKKCEYCDKRFFDNEGEQKYCSEKCRAKAFSETKTALWKTLAVKDNIKLRLKEFQLQFHKTMHREITYNDLIEIFLDIIDSEVDNLMKKIDERLPFQ